MHSTYQRNANTADIPRDRTPHDAPRVPPDSGPWARCWMPGGDLITPGCGKPVKPLCDVSKIGRITRNIAPQTPWANTPAPIRSEFFQCLAARFTVTQNDDPSANLRLFIQQWIVNDQAVENFSGTPGLAQLSGCWTDDYVLPEGYGVPVRGYIVSQPNMVNVMTIGGVSFYAAGGPSADFASSFYGNALGALPPGYTGAC